MRTIEQHVKAVISDFDSSMQNAGADPGFFLRGGAPCLNFNTNKPHSFFAEYQLL